MHELADPSHRILNLAQELVDVSEKIIDLLVSSGRLLPGALGQLRRCLRLMVVARRTALLPLISHDVPSLL